MKQYFDIFDTPFGCLFCLVVNEKISILHFNSSLIPQSAVKEFHPLLKECKTQLQAYFDKKLKNFSLPLFLNQDSFRQKVLINLLDIPYGTTMSYKDYAKIINTPKAFRAVGNALSKNPLLLLLPCHRVIQSNGAYGNYIWGKHTKAKLLQIENSLSSKSVFLS